ncbi:NADP(H)-dependent aldo-keto reductase [Halorhodospira halophila]|uniref:Protein tas n=1 Tax=Halorhodospira halophila (strain DSM 244 / SL1) TaxID=349124 RepID=A1WZD6_HALHL|nr:NADP(H)-dependent aldo-keto reductase [Halorhodospira halophila]ABM63048.1 aldo/keto reductase [Halorhodospira halophila SL1]MBK1727831.1 NADP(H)-dependent aldo-keto reductase [Halorhodospira halophila]
MEYRPLGHSELRVSAICLGTMTWGEQNSEAEAHAQLDLAAEHGVNFIDAAEMYPVPPRAETAGRTEAYLGNWLARQPRREDLVIATKIAGPGLDSIRDGQRAYTPEQLREAVDGSLQRLRTDYIDLYQLHWPERPANYFGRLDYPCPEDDGREHERIRRALEGLAELVDAGKIRHIGLSNETPWGAMRFIAEAERLGLPRIVSIQNPYNLLNRSYEVGLAEVSHREGCGLLAYSPLGFGVLSGKYLDGQRPAEARLTLFERFQRYTGERGVTATRAYVDLARKHGLDPAQMAIAFATQRPFCTSTIIGATTTEQLRTNMEAGALALDGALLQEIDTLHQANPNPCP